MLSEDDFARAAFALDAPIAHIKAVCEVEAPGGGFDAEGRPRILFEAHRFAKLTGGVYNIKYANISSTFWNRQLYAKGADADARNAGEHSRLELAASLNRNAALMSTSWGRFQILGENFHACGFSTLQDFINAMYRGEGAQLDAFVNFIAGDRTKLAALRTGDWATFARLYNGPAYKANAYDAKLAQAAEKYA